MRQPLRILRGHYLSLIGVVGCLGVGLGPREWGLGLGSAGLLLIIMRYMVKDIFDQR